MFGLTLLDLIFITIWLVIVCFTYLVLAGMQLRKGKDNETDEDKTSE